MAGTMSITPQTSPARRGHGRLLLAAAWRHRYIHALALGTLALSLAVGWHTHSMPDLGTVSDFGLYLLAAFWIGGCGFAIVKLAWLAIVERDPHPLSSFLRPFGQFFANGQRLANGVNGIAAFIVFTSAFGVLKGSISILTPFSWDERLMRFDRFLHFGKAPHEWLGWLVDSPLAVLGLNFAYNFWFVTLVGSIFACAITQRDTALRHRYLLSLMTLWLVGGFLVAMGFSSAGPCYFARLGLGDAYKPLTDALAAAARSHPIWALQTQDALWNGYLNIANGNTGISAFPSLHVATAVLVALYAGNRSALAGALLWVFAVLIMTGSVVLGWHYAVDGYAGAAIALAVWKTAGLFVERFPAADLPAR